ncbi:MAG TPA: uroporphyrinogen decarboxylase family protein [Oscillospiraceae bacterium]|nr:uroporphyrinogen decarboxylase family protein [Oscillospiraceae bacterium]HPF56280.1 uroporphyrinogen decarboxylase family protein [Clostridiales bacterium]HPK35390.1 uroporphyrinogen decarboxylase family protein [Oscillospiraceae bacterium]HPR75317.1 uroporphyrinogen decarboxylase family protein [Oscillospiraceae bacterium]
MMTSREIMLATLNFEKPERVALNLKDPNNPVFDDTCWISALPDKQFDGSWKSPEEVLSKYPDLKNFRGEVRTDEYGNLWGRLPGDFGCGEVIHGAITDWEQLKDYQLPHISDKARFANSKKDFVKDKFSMGGLPGYPFAIMRYIRKMEYFFEDLLLERENVMILNEMVMKEILGVIDNYGELGTDAIFTCEDWGTQDRLLISPALWREVFKPSIKRIFDRIHEHGMYAIMHSCGYIWEILPDLVEIGVDCMQFDAPTLMGMQRVSDLFGKKVSMFSPVDIQTILPIPDPEVTRRSAREMIDTFCPKGGGLILKDYGDYKTIQIPPENVAAMHDEFINYGANLSRFYK